MPIPLGVHTLRAPLVVCMAGVIAACVASDPTGPNTVTAQLQLSGSVVSTSGDLPIAGATVRLGIGVSDPVVVDSAYTDAMGEFAFTASVERLSGTCDYWLGASADGYRTSDPALDAVFIQCFSDPQIVEIRLDPD
jgi:hypothetical protein